MMTNRLDTDALSARYRAKLVDLDGKRMLLTNFYGSQQEGDLSLPPNCGGYGRIHHFRRTTNPGWPTNPLPIDPASRYLDLPAEALIKAQVFQLAACNWRCWYCFVPFDLLAASPKHSGWLTPAEILDLYLAEPERPAMIDLSGGQPDLVPEWVPWMMVELRARGLEREVYLWSDDNLSNDYFWRYLTTAEQELVASYPGYGRVCCFKGFDPTSFAFNTKADPALFERQFDLFGRLLNLGFDLYAYATFTTPTWNDVGDQMVRFVDRLQAIHEYLPLRTVPLKIEIYSPVEGRLNEATTAAALQGQEHAIEAWQREIERRFTSAQRALKITAVSLAK